MKQPYPFALVHSSCVLSFLPFDCMNLYRSLSLAIAIARHRYRPSPSSSDLVIAIVISRAHAIALRSHSAISSNRERGLGSPISPSDLISELTRRVPTYVTCFRFPRRSYRNLLGRSARRLRSALTAPPLASSPITTLNTELAHPTQLPLEIVHETPATAHDDMDLDAPLWERDASEDDSWRGNRGQGRSGCGSQVKASLVCI